MFGPAFDEFVVLWRRGTVASWPCCVVTRWRRGSMALWLVAPLLMTSWLCGFVALWRRGSMAPWLCGLWLHGSVASWLDGLMASLLLSFKQKLSYFFPFLYFYFLYLNIAQFMLT